MSGNGGKPRGQVNMWSGTHTGNQGRAKRLCHTGKRWERQIGTKRQVDLRTSQGGEGEGVLHVKSTSSLGL